MQIASQKVERIVAIYSDDVDGVLLDLLFISEKIGFKEKVQLLEKTARKMSREKLCNVLRHLNADKIANNLSGGKKRVKVTEESTQIIQALLNAGVISNPVHASEGQTYKTIRYHKDSE